MHKLLAAITFTTVFAIHSAASAAIVTISPPGQLSNGNPVASFDSLTPTAYGSTTPAGSFVDGGASFSGSGLIMQNGGQPSMGLYAQPFHDTTNYLAILGGRSETITYSGDRHSFGLYWGSIDPYNTITFYNDGVAFLSYAGNDLAPLVADGNQRSDASNRYVTFSDLTFDRVVLSSNGNSFEVDNITAGVPELSTWLMMLIGFGGLGLVARSRAKRAPAFRLA
jgi:fibronectin-binding autotransporter adhesin